MVGAFVHSPWAAAFAVLGIVLAALYILLMYQRTMTGPVREGVAGMRDLNVREVAALAPLLLLIVVLGFFPKPLLDVINPAVEHTLKQVGKRPTPQPDRSPKGRPARVNGPRASSTRRTSSTSRVSPILIVLGVAVLGVLVEAFVPRARRYLVQDGARAASAWSPRSSTVGDGLRAT